MSFLAPIFLFGAAAIALPVLFHLIRRSVKERTVFSSLMFLQPSPPRVTRRSRLENLLLLLLRCAALCLLAAGFARPFLKHAFPPDQRSGPGKRTLVLLDTSASMRRQSLWAAARDKAEAIARAATPADSIGLYVFGSQLKALVTWQQWAETPVGDRFSLIRSRLAELSPGWTATALDSGVIEAAELFGNPGEQEFSAREIVVISDFQEGSRVTALQGHQWPKGVAVIPERVTPRSGDNAGLQLVTDSTDSAPVGESVVRVRVSNASDSKRDEFQVGWAGADGSFIGQPTKVYVPAGQDRILSLPNPQSGVAADRITLLGDSEPFDNTVFVLPPPKAEALVLYLGEDVETDNRQPLYFLKRALQDTRRQTIRVASQRPSASLSSAQASAANLIVVTAAVDESLGKGLRELVLQGKTVVCAPANTQAAESLGPILGMQSVTASENQSESYAMLAELDFTHPLLASFADPRFSDFTKVHFWKHRKLDLGGLADARTVARFDSGDPAIVEIPAGKGHLVLLASGWHPQDSQLALSSKFVPLVYALLGLGGATAPPPQQYLVGSALPATNTATIRTPRGAEVKLSANEPSFTPSEPGVYTLQNGGQTTRIAVNLDPAESRTGPLPADELDRLGVPGPASHPSVAVEKDRKVRLQNVEVEARQKLWRWLLGATLLVLVLETWLAGRTARRALPTEETV